MKTIKHYALSGQRGLEKKRRTFFALGMICALSLSLVAFEWKVPVRELKAFGDLRGKKVETDIVVFRVIPDEPKPEKKPEEKPVVKQKEGPVKEVANTQQESPSKNIFNLPDTAAWERPVLKEETPDPFPVPLAGWQVEKPATFPGGEEALLQFIRNHVNYPQWMVDNGIEGTVYIEFVVDKNGHVIQPRILGARGANTAPLEKESLRVAKLIPRWKPAYQGPIPVAMYVNIPIEFIIRH